VFAHRASADPIPFEKAQIVYLHKQMAIRLMLFEVYSARKSTGPTSGARTQARVQVVLGIRISFKVRLNTKTNRNVSHFT